MAIILPTNRLGRKEIQTQKRNIPIDQIIAAEGQNPVAQGIETAGNLIGQTLQKRAELLKQGQELAQLERLGQVPPGTYANLDTGTARTFATQQIRDNQEGKKSPLGQPFVDKDGNAYQYFYDNKNQKTTAELLPKGVPPPKTPPGSSGTLVQSGLFDSSGQPIMINNKSGKSQTIALPDGTVGTTQTKTQLTPTSQTRASGEFAASVIPHIQDFKGQITVADQAGYLGPLRGRYQQFMTGQIGSTGNDADDYMLGKLKSTRDFLASASMKAHVGNRGGGEMLEHFLSDMDTGKQSAAVLQGELDGLLPFMEGYVEAGKGGLRSISPPKPRAIAPPLSPAAQRLIDKHK